MKKALLTVLVSLFLGMLVHGQMAGEPTESKPVEVSDPVVCTDESGQRTIVMIKTVVRRGGEYNVLFRILPALINGTCLTSFDVHLDGRKIGTITPERHGWQNLPMDSGKLLV